MNNCIKTYKVYTEYTFSGCFDVVAESKEKAKLMVTENCSMVTDMKIQSTLDKNKLHWGFNVFPKMKIKKVYLSSSVEFADEAAMNSYYSHYETIIVKFDKPIAELDGKFDDVAVWGVATLKEWIDSYERTRFTAIDSHTAVITSGYNMYSVKEWLIRNTPIAEMTER